MRKNLNLIVLAILFCFAFVALAGGVTDASEYIVKQGDTLWGIAKRHKISYERLCELNNKSNDWSQITVGQKNGWGWTLGEVAVLVGIAAVLLSYRGVVVY